MRLPPWIVPALFVLPCACASPRKEYSPEQPIAYSHKLHAGELGIDCKYCHVTVEEGRHASIPSVQICMNCHAAVGKDKDGVIKLTKYWDEQRPVPWVKVHDLPDFAYFDHSRHLKAGLDCDRCHGDLKTMERVRTVNAFNMGWCVDCHRDPQVKGRPELRASTDCMICHR